MRNRIRKFLRFLFIKPFRFLFGFLASFLYKKDDVKLKNPYLANMLTGFNPLARLFLSFVDRRFQIKAAHLKKLTETFSKTNQNQKTLPICVMRNSGWLEYAYFNFLFLKNDLTPIHFNNTTSLIFLGSIKEMIQWKLKKWAHDYYYGFSQNPLSAGHFEKLLHQNQPILINFKVNRSYLLGGQEIDTDAYLKKIIQVSQKNKIAIDFVPQQVILDRHPESSEKSIGDFLFGEKTNPGFLRKFYMFLKALIKKATVEIGEPISLTNYLSEKENLAQENLATQLKIDLLEHLDVQRRRVTGPKITSREMIWKQMADDDFLKTLNQLPSKKKKLKQKRKLSHKLFREMAAQISYSYVDIYDKGVHWLVHKLYNGVSYNKEAIQSIREIAGKHPIVLVPSHRSHIDYLLLSHIFYRENLTVPHVCAGINLKFWPVAHFIRRGGGFYIRRQIKGQKFYSFVLHSYLKTLLRIGYTLEFFIEGTRSRSGKLLSPKMGILSMLIQVFLKKQVEDIAFVPISISYEKPIESQSYLNEAHGQKKQKENFSGLVKAREKFKSNHGQIHLRFAKPLSLKEFHQNHLETNQSNSQFLIEKFAYTLTYHINRESVVMPHSFITLALLTPKSKSLTEEELSFRYDYLKNYLDYKKAPYAQAFAESTKEQVLKNTLIKLTEEKLIEKKIIYKKSFYRIDESKRMQLDYYKNNSLHFFVSLSCVVKMILLNQAQKIKLADLVSQYEIFQTLLRHDFIFSQRAKIDNHLKRVFDFLIDQEWAKESPNEPQTYEIDPQFYKHDAIEMFGSLLDNFYESYYLTLTFIQKAMPTKMAAKEMVRAILDVGKKLYQIGEIEYFEALSQFNIQNALKVFCDLGLIKTERTHYKRQLDSEIAKQWLKTLADLIYPKNKAKKQNYFLNQEESPPQNLALH